jgi:hypothetical protein
MIKPFRTFIKEQESKKNQDINYYTTLNLYSDMSNEDVVYYMNQLLKEVYKMLKKSDEVLITLEPVNEDK